MHSATSPTQISSPPARGATCPTARGSGDHRASSGVNVPLSAEEMLPVRRLQYGNPSSGLPSGRLVTRLGELSITFKPQCRQQDDQLDDELWQV